MTKVTASQPIGFSSLLPDPTHGIVTPLRKFVASEQDATGGPVDADAILAYWFDYMGAEGCTATTIKERGILVRALIERTQTPLLEITRHHLIADLARNRADGKPLSAKTKQNYRSLYHTLFTWMQDEGFRADNPAARLPRTRVPSTEPDPVTTDDITYLLNSGIYAKSRMYVLLYAYQGFRAIEIAAVSGESIDWTRQRIRSDEAKGGKIVWRPLHPIVWEELQKYPRTGYLFPSGDGHVSRKTVSNVLSKAMKRAGINHRPHQLRAWHATELVEAGVSTIVAQHSMRHSNLMSMNRYARVSESTIREAMDRLPPVVVPQKSGRSAA